MPTLLFGLLVVAGAEVYSPDPFLALVLHILQCRSSDAAFPGINYRQILWGCLLLVFPLADKLGLRNWAF